MANKGVTIEDLLPLGVTLNIPPFFRSNTQMTTQDVIKTQEIASVRIHVLTSNQQNQEFSLMGLCCTPQFVWHSKPNVECLHLFM